MLPTLTASKATLLCTRPISKEVTFPSTGLSCKTRRLAGNQPRRKWLLVMEQSRETLSCTFWSREGKCWSVDMKITTGNYVGFDCCCKHIFRSSAPERLVSPPRFARFFIRQVSEFWDHNFSTASDYITAKRDKKAVVDICLKLFWSFTIIIMTQTLSSETFFIFVVTRASKKMTWYLYCSFQPEITDHFLFFFSRAKKVIHEMPPSHFVDLRLVKTNLDKEGLKFQLEEHAVARILEVWGLLGSHYHCESRHCL